MKRKSVLSSRSGYAPSILESVLNVACPYTPVLSIFFSIALLFTMLSLLVVFTQPPDSEAFIVSSMTIVVNGFTMTFTGVLLYLCRKHRFG